MEFQFWVFKIFPKFRFSEKATKSWHNISHRIYELYWSNSEVNIEEIKPTRWYLVQLCASQCILVEVYKPIKSNSVVLGAIQKLHRVPPSWLYFFYINFWIAPSTTELLFITLLSSYLHRDVPSFLCHIFILIYFLKYENIVRSTAWSFVIQIQVQAVCETSQSILTTMQLWYSIKSYQFENQFWQSWYSLITYNNTTIELKFLFKICGLKC